MWAERVLAGSGCDRGAASAETGGHSGDGREQRFNAARGIVGGVRGGGCDQGTCTPALHLPTSLPITSPQKAGGFAGLNAHLHVQQATALSVALAGGYDE